MSYEVEATLACWSYDRTFPLQSGIIKPEGIKLNYLSLQPFETFWRQLNHFEFEVSEMSLSYYLSLLSRGNQDLIAIPVFPSRTFRHNSIFIHKDSGIEKPEDLRGKRFGLFEYQQTASIWIRGLLDDEYGISPKEISWYVGGLDKAGLGEKIPLQIDDVKIQQIEQSKTLTQMLINGEIDALAAPRVPADFHMPNTKLRRLFVDYQKTEEEYFKKTGIFPIMHTVVLKRSFYEKYPWAAQSFFKAFTASKKWAIHNISEAHVLNVTLPWVMPYYDNAKAVMGEDYWPYGIEKNRKVLEAAIDYCYRQGLTKQKFVVEDLFAPGLYDIGL